MNPRCDQAQMFHFLYRILSGCSIFTLNIIWELVSFIVLLLYGLKQLVYEILLILTIPTLRDPMCEISLSRLCTLLLSIK
jgi:hypothetical protein